MHTTNLPKIRMSLICGINGPFSDPVQKVTLACSDLSQSLEYWIGLLGLEVYEKSEDNTVTLGYAETQAKLELKDIGLSTHFFSI